MDIISRNNEDKDVSLLQLAMPILGFVSGSVIQIGRAHV